MSADVFLDRYRIVRPIGRGAMGVVYEAMLDPIAKRVALKVLAPKLTADRRARARFVREARAMAQISSRHVVKVIDFAERPQVYFAMEYLQGQDLAGLLRDRGRLSWAEAKPLLLQLCAGVAEAHGCGVVHRDLKPSNVFVTVDGAGQQLIKVLDFGIAKVAEPDGGKPITQTHEALGTVAYMAPEQARGREVDARTDVYALGIVMHQVLSGRVPFRGASAFETLELHVRTRAPRLRDSVPDIPRAVEEAVSRCLCKEPGERFASVAALAQALDAVPRLPVVPVEPTQMLGTLGSRVSVGPTIVLGQPRAKPRRRTVWLGVGLTAALAAAAGVGSLAGPQPRDLRVSMAAAVPSTDSRPEAAPRPLPPLLPFPLPPRPAEPRVEREAAAAPAPVDRPRRRVRSPSPAVDRVEESATPEPPQSPPTSLDPFSSVPASKAEPREGGRSPVQVAVKAGRARALERCGETLRGRAVALDVMPTGSVAKARVVPSNLCATGVLRTIRFPKQRKAKRVTFEL